MMCHTKLRRHFTPQQLSLHHHDPKRFVRGPFHSSPGPLVSTYFLAYRLTMMVLFVAPLLWSVYEHWALGKWFIYLTHWGFLVCTVQATWGAVLVANAYSVERRKGLDPADTQKPEEVTMPLTYKIYWVLFNISIPVAFFITILYWSLLYNPSKPNDVSFTMNFLMHGFNSILCIVDLGVGGLPSRFLHFLQPLSFATAYLIFNILFWAFGGKDPKGNPWVYFVLDWSNNPNTAILLAFMCFFFMTLIHLVVCGLAKLRSKCKRRPMGHTVMPTLSQGTFNKAFVEGTA